MKKQGKLDKIRQKMVRVVDRNYKVDWVARENQEGWDMEHGKGGAGQRIRTYAKDMA